MADELEALISFCETDGRICPVQTAWQQLWQLLPERRRSKRGWEPPLPLILAGWSYSTDTQKRSRLAEHLRWADEHDALPEVGAFLRNLSIDDWHRAERRCGAKPSAVRTAE